MQTLEGKTAAITGAASGIGRALAVRLVEQGCSVALSDVDPSGLDETAAMCQGRGVPVTCKRVDVAVREDVYTWAESVVQSHGKVNLIFNNAGVALGSTVESMCWEDMEWLMGVNFWGVVNGTKAFLPHLIASGAGHVVNVSSVFGLISVPTQSAYNAAKFGVRGFTDALAMELKVARHPVRATTVHPGGIRTNIVKNARFDSTILDSVGDTELADGRFKSISMTSPDRAARLILTAVRKRRRRVTVGPDAKLIDLLSRLPASIYQEALVLGARRELT